MTTLSALAVPAGRLIAGGTSSILSDILDKAHAGKWENLPFGELMGKVGLEFVGTPYEGGTLESTGREQCRVVLDGLDCVTYFESVLAIAWMIKNGKTAMSDLVDRVEFTRYRGGKLNGYTDSVEMYSVSGGSWVEGPRMSSSRYSHCAVGLGNGSVITTGGYGGLASAERLDIATGRWTALPELNPVRAQHGCALVTVDGEEGVIVVGGDSGGTRLKDVRFLPLARPTEWRRMADLNTARWGRPAVGVVGGRITVAAGWDGTRDLNTVEYYDERLEKWRLTASRLQTERRWPSATEISLSLFPKCVQRRQ